MPDRFMSPEDRAAYLRAMEVVAEARIAKQALWLRRAVACLLLGLLALAVTLLILIGQVGDSADRSQDAHRDAATAKTAVVTAKRKADAKTRQIDKKATRTRQLLNRTIYVVGKAGIQGLPGKNGTPGPAGPIGLTGPAGPQGPEGPIGKSGPQGATGLQGAKGDPGPMGSVGPQGPQGEKGDKGDPGTPAPPPPQNFRCTQDALDPTVFHCTPE